MDDVADLLVGRILDVHVEGVVLLHVRVVEPGEDRVGPAGHAAQLVRDAVVGVVVAHAQHQRRTLGLARHELARDHAVAAVGQLVGALHH